MSNHSTNSYGHRIRKLGCYYRLSWTKDTYYPNSRLRFPKIYVRDTDLKGAIRFAKKWGIDFDPSAEEEIP